MLRGLLPQRPVQLPRDLHELGVVHHQRRLLHRVPMLVGLLRPAGVSELGSELLDELAVLLGPHVLGWLLHHLHLSIVGAVVHLGVAVLRRLLPQWAVQLEEHLRHGVVVRVERRLLQRILLLQRLLPLTVAPPGVRARGIPAGVGWRRRDAHSVLPSRSVPAMKSRTRRSSCARSAAMVPTPATRPSSSIAARSVTAAASFMSWVTIRPAMP